MKKIMVCMMVALGTSFVTMAQTDSKFKVSLGPELSFASGAFSNTHSFGIGGTIQAEVLLQEHLYGTATFGVISYNGKSNGVGTKNKGQTFLPLRVGVKYFLAGGIYGAFQTGVAFLNNGQGTAFAYSPQLGYEFNTKSGKAVDATFKYDGYSGAKTLGTVGALGFRLAYIF
ncbi:hypothetical protein QWZ08_09070 [Ferruginibacter paludis]|uniref:hypothetical protein n=1 Tax=Ferruginibacter paludis TaxID=1310417 RepID=UPI0025B59598|nr:hypothetical protein [Ferruginibacter paludis]MDN3655773.1 hypothetical protein [Ferruginibacter paludis]